MKGSAEEIIEACTTSMRQHILQALTVSGEYTTDRTGKKFSDIPRAALHRRMKILLDATGYTGYQGDAEPRTGFAPYPVIFMTSCLDILNSAQDLRNFYSF